MAISNTHARIVAACAAGEWADLSKLPDGQREIEAGIIRDLMLGLRRSGAMHKEIAGRFVDYRPFADEAQAAAPFFVAAPGVRIRGARIRGHLDLSDCVGPSGEGLPRLALEDCFFEIEGTGGGVINLAGAHLAGLSLNRSRFSCLWAPRSVVQSGVSLAGVRPVGEWRSQTFDVDDPQWPERLERGDLSEQEQVAEAWPTDPGRHCSVFLVGATLRGLLDIGDARLRAPGGHHALTLEGAIIEGAAIFTTLVAEGGVNIVGARIRGMLDFGGTRLIANGSYALSGEGAVIEAGVLFRAGFVARGQIRLLAAKIGGGLVLAETRCDIDLSRASEENEADDWNAITADLLEVTGNVMIQEGVHVAGRVWLHGMRVTGNLVVTNDVVIDGCGLEALLLDSALIDKSLLIRDGVTLLGDLRMLGTVVAKDFELHRVRLRSPGRFAWCAPRIAVGARLMVTHNHVEGGVQLADGACGTLADQSSGYGDADKIVLDGFRYDRIEVLDGCWLSRSRWLARQYASRKQVREPDPGKTQRAGWLERFPLLHDLLRPLPMPRSLNDYHPQPYLQLSRRLAGQGHLEDARRILSLRRTVERKMTGHWLTGPLTGMFWLFFDYGLSAKRAVVTMLLALALGSGLVALANHRGALVVDAQSVAVQPRRRCPEPSPAATRSTHRSTPSTCSSR